MVHEEYVKGVTESNDCDKEYEEELSHIIDDLHNHSNVEVSLLEDTEEVEESQPHC
jgi:hypothetical protein